MSEQNFPNGKTEIFKKAWRGFTGNRWTDEVNAAPAEATDKLWGRLQELQKEERARGGVLECETEVVSSLTAYGPGYIDERMKDLETIVGLQTDKPLKRAFMPYGGIRMAQEAAETYGYKVNEKYDQIFNEYRKTHNQAVFDAYTPEMKVARHCHIVTGLPDTYHTSARGDRGADPCAPGNEGYGRDLRLRYLRSGNEREGSYPVALFRLPRRYQDPERRRNERRTHLHVH